MKKIILLLCLIFVSLNGYCYYVGETFTKECDGVNIFFRIISNDEIACYPNYNSGSNNTSCIDWDYTGEVVIPESVEYDSHSFSVTEIALGAFHLCDISSLTLPSTLKRIESYSIYGCRSLHEITIPQSVTYIEEGAFESNYFNAFNIEDGNNYYCVSDGVLFTKDMKTLLSFPGHSNYRQSYVIPSSVTRIANRAFYSCWLSNVTIPSSVTEIGDLAFHYNYYLSSFYIPSSVLSLGEGVCTGYSEITSIEVDPANPVYTAIDGVVYTKDGDKLMAYPTANTQTNYDIIDGTKELGLHSFSNANNLESISIPNSVSKIGSCAFINCI